jgi:hypothetical protein
MEPASVIVQKVIIFGWVAVVVLGVAAVEAGVGAGALLVEEARVVHGKKYYRSF